MKRSLSILVIMLAILTAVACDQAPITTEVPSSPTAEGAQTSGSVTEQFQATKQRPTESATTVAAVDLEPSQIPSPGKATPLTTPTPIQEGSGQAGDGEGQAEKATVEQLLSGLDGLAIDDFLDRSFELILLRRPQWITELGLEDHFGMRNNRLDNLSIAYINQSYDLQEAILDRLHKFDKASLTAEQQISYDIYDWWLQQEVAGRPFMYDDYPVHHFLNGYQDNLFLLFTDTHPMNSKEDAEDYISRLSQVDDQIAQVIDGLEIRTELGIIPPDFILRLTRQRMIRDLGQQSLAPDLLRPGNIALYTAFLSKVQDIEGLSEQEQKALREAAALEVEHSFFPAYLDLIDYLDSIVGQATPDAGLWRLPDGEDYYDYLLTKSTSTGMTAAEIHELGLAEVARIQAELYELFADLGYDTSQDLESLMYRAIDQGGYISGSAKIIEAYYGLIAGAEANLGQMFDIAPEAELIVIGDQRGGGGYYLPATIDGSRPGAFHAGVGGQIPWYFMPTVTYHEGVPGHHFQIALAQEMDLPLFRNVLQYNGFVEGWALYAERLAKEMYLYTDDPFGDVGRLELELLRAVRLVTDTGIHSLGWTRQQARDYMIEAMGGSGWVHEVERYVVLPGQATGYMVGMLTILEQRQRALTALGEQFDIVEFHRVVLENGSLPLEILEEVVDQWIASRQATT